MVLGWFQLNKESIEKTLKIFFESALILVFGWWVVGVITSSLKKIMIRARIDAGVVSFVMSILKAALRIIVLLSVADHIGIPITPLLTALGAAAVTAGLAIKDSLSNIASGMLIIVNKMFSVGDYLKIDAIEGEVRKIELFFTTLVTDDNKQILIPNLKITSNNVINYTAYEKRRLDLNYNVEYDTDLDKAKNLLVSVIERNEKFLKHPDYIIETGEYKEIGITIVVRVWCKTNEYTSLYFYMQRTVKEEFAKNNIKLSFNKIDVNLLGGDKDVV